MTVLRFVPVSPDDPGPVLPQQVQKQLAEAANVERKIAYYVLKNPKRGPAPMRQAQQALVGFVTDSNAELDTLMLHFEAVVGPERRGNKRRGQQALYADLVAYFHLLKRRGITLPRNKSLSARAVALGLGEILRRHSYTTDSDETLIRRGDRRQALADKLDRVFSRVAKVVENTPA